MKLSKEVNNVALIKILALYKGTNVLAPAIKGLNGVPHTVNSLLDCNCIDCGSDSNCSNCD